MANRSNTFLLKRSNVLNKIPVLSGLTIGELALNTADAKLYTLYTEGLTGATEVREIGWNRLSISGGTVTGNILVTGSVSATTFYGNGQYLTGISSSDNYVTGGTFNSSTNTLTLNRQNGSVIITGFTSSIGGSVTGFTYSDNNLTILQSDGNNLTTNISVMTGLTVNGNLVTLNLYTDYLFDSNDSYGTPGQILVTTPTGIQWVDASNCNLTSITTSGLETKTIGFISGFTSGSYIVKSYITTYSGTSKYGFWERTLGVVTTGGTPITSIITQDFDDYSSGFVPSQVIYTPTSANTIDIIVSGLTNNGLYWESYYDIIGQSCRPIVNVLPSSNLGTFGLTIGNGVSVITTGQKGYVKMPYPGTINDWTILSEISGSIVIDLWKDNYINFPITSADTITGGNYAYLSNQNVNTDNVLSGWTKDFLVNDVFVFNVLSADTVTNINLTINVIKT